MVIIIRVEIIVIKMGNINRDGLYLIRLIFISFSFFMIRIVLFLIDFFVISRLWIVFWDLFWLIYCFCVRLFFFIIFCWFFIFIFFRNRLVCFWIDGRLSLLLCVVVHLSFVFFGGCHRCVWVVIWLNFFVGWTTIWFLWFVFFVHFFSSWRRNVRLNRLRNHFFYFWFNLIFWYDYRNDRLMFFYSFYRRLRNDCLWNFFTWFYLLFYYRLEGRKKNFIGW